MKAIILVSSIFYILGLKISNKIDLVKKTSPADTTISQTVVVPQLNPKQIDFTTAEKELNVAESTTTKSEETTEESL